MRLRVEQLAKHLQNDLLPVYLVAGDEPLQQDECLDALRASARQKGFDERHRFSADTGIDWNALLNESQSMSLFGGRRILELVLLDLLRVLARLLDLDVEDRARLAGLVAARLVVQLLDLLVARVEDVLEVVWG